ncbi:MAG: site-specific integrase [Bifidobacterium sp.]|jgi:integrase
MLLGEFVEQIYWADRAGLRECTLAGYRSAWDTHIEPAWGKLDLDSPPGDAEVARWLAGFPRPGAARKSWAVMRGMLRRAVRLGHADPGMAALAPELPRVPRYIAATLDARQIRILLRGFYGHELEAWLVCSVCLGLRREEACGLTWRDIDLRSGIVHIRRGAQWVSGHLVVDRPKTELSRRDVVLPRFALIRLRQLRAKGAIAGSLTPQQVARRYHAWCTRERLPYVPAKNLRHSWATTALQAKVDISVVAKQLGHSDIATTARYYLRPDTAILRAAQRDWERLIMK